MRVVRYIEDTVVGSGAVTAPSAGDTIATIAAADLPAGTYEVYALAGISGNAVGDLGNVELQVAGVDFLSPLPQGASGGQQATLIPRVTLDGSQALAVKAIGAGTAGIEYSASIIATKVESS